MWNVQRRRQFAPQSPVACVASQVHRVHNQRSRQSSFGNPYQSHDLLVRRGGDHATHRLPGVGLIHRRFGKTRLRCSKVFFAVKQYLCGFPGKVLRKKKWCCERGLNSRPHPYQGCALPLSYHSAGAVWASALPAWRLIRRYLAALQGLSRAADLAGNLDPARGLR